MIGKGENAWGGDGRDEGLHTGGGRERGRKEVRGGQERLKRGSIARGGGGKEGENER